MKTQEDKTEEPKQPPPALRAHRSWHWRCECGQVNLAVKSRTHIDKCWACARTFTVLIPKGVE